jgi:hypothetical protein
MKRNISSIYFGVAVMAMLCASSGFGYTDQGTRSGGSVPMSPDQRLYEDLIWQDSNDAWLNANSAYGKGDDKSAEEWALKSLKAAPVASDGIQPPAFELLAKIYLKQGRNADIVKLYERKDLNRSGLDNSIYLGLANVRLGNYDAALKYFNNYKAILLKSFKDVAADFPGVNTPKNLEASLLLCKSDNEQPNELYNDMDQAHAILPENPLIALRYGEYSNYHRFSSNRTQEQYNKDLAEVNATQIEMYSIAIANGHETVKKEAQAKLDKLKTDFPEAFKTDKDKATAPAAPAAGSVTPAK